MTPGYPIIIAVLPKRPTFSAQVNAEDYIPNPNIITASQNPTTCIFRNLNIDTTSNSPLNQWSINTGTQIGYQWCNFLCIRSPIPNQPLTLKLYLKLFENVSGNNDTVYKSQWENLKLQILTDAGSTVYAIDNTNIGVPKTNEIKCYTFSNIILNDCVDSTGYLNIGFETIPAGGGSGYVQVAGIEIYQDVNLNGSVAYNKEEWVSSYQAFEINLGGALASSASPIHYNSINFGYAYSSSSGTSNMLVTNELE